MKTLKRLKSSFVIPGLIFISVMFMAANCDDFNSEMLFKLVGDVPEKVYNCVEDTCEITVQIETDRPIDSLLIKYGGDQGYEEIDFEGLEDGTYQVTITLERGVNNITLKGLEGLSFSELSFTLECVCPEEGVPEISWDPDKPPTDTTTEDTAKLNIKSDKALDALKVTTNGQKQVTQNPEAEQDGDAFNYQTTVELQGGDNEIEVQGENENGSSNSLQHQIKKGQPPDIFFNPVPPEEIYICVNDECTYIIKIHELSGVINPDWKLTNLVHQVGSGGDLIENSVEPDDENNFSIFVNLQKGPNVITITGFNRFGSDSLTCTIECVCGEPSSPTIHLEPDLPPTTTNDTVPLNIKSDQELDQITVFNSAIAEPNVIDNPEPVENEDGFLYETNQPLVEGDNDITVQGKNENGFSNPVGGNIKKGEPPAIDFAEQPQTPVTNCVEEECKVSISISCDNFNEIACQVGDGDAISYYKADLSDDAQGNYPIPVTLQKGTNVITFTAKNEFGTSNTISCSIECICDSPQPGYTKEQLIGETEIPKPIGIDFYPDYQQQQNFLNVLTKTAGDETQIMHGELTGGAFGNKYPNATLPANVGGYAFNGNDKTNLLLLPDQVKKLESDGQTLNSLYTFPEGQNGQVGQLKFQDVDTSYITKSITEIFYLNRNGAQVFSSNNKIVGLDIMRDAYNNTALYEKTALGTVRQTGSDGRATEQSILTLADSGQVTELFDIPLSDGMIIDVITDVLPDHETVHFIVTTVKNETEYWVNIYNQAGERLHAFKTHDLSELEETSGETIFYKVIKAKIGYWPDGKLYIIHSEFPGVQVWAPEE